MSETETRATVWIESDLVDFDEAKMWRGEVGPSVAEEFAAK